MLLCTDHLQSLTLNLKMEETSDYLSSTISFFLKIFFCEWLIAFFFQILIFLNWNERSCSTAARACVLHLRRLPEGNTAEAWRAHPLQGVRLPHSLQEADAPCCAVWGALRERTVIARRLSSFRTPFAHQRKMVLRFSTPFFQPSQQPRMAHLVIIFRFGERKKERKGMLCWERGTAWRKQGEGHAR